MYIYILYNIYIYIYIYIYIIIYIYVSFREFLFAVLIFSKYIDLEFWLRKKNLFKQAHLFP